MDNHILTSNKRKNSYKFFLADANIIITQCGENLQVTRGR